MTPFDLDLSKYQLGWSDEVEYAFTPEKGINPGVVEQISWWKGEPQWMTPDAPAGAAHCSSASRWPTWFAVNMPDIDFQDIYYYLQPAGRAGRRVGPTSPTQMKATYEKLGHPRGRAQVPRRRHRAVRVRSRLPPQPRGPRAAGDPVLRHGHRAARVPRPRQAVLRHGHPARRQQVRRAQHRRCGAAARSSTCRRASSARCRCRPTSASTPRTPASSSAR